MTTSNGITFVGHAPYTDAARITVTTAVDLRDTMHHPLATHQSRTDTIHMHWTGYVPLFVPISCQLSQHS